VTDLSKGNQVSQDDIVQVLEPLQAMRAKMKAACAGVGEPCVELPMLELKAYKDADGFWHAIIGMDQLIYLVDGLLRSRT